MDGIGGTISGAGAAADGEVTVFPHFGHGPVTPARWTGTVKEV